jgi:Flp pilus assembly protein TadG
VPGANDRGAEAVEFALIIPVFLLMVFGVVDFGFMINRDTITNNASREGAREGSINPNLNSVLCKVRNEMSTIETPAVGGDCKPTPTKITVTVTCRKPVTVAIPTDITPCGTPFPTDAASGGTVIVKVDYLHSWITPALSPVAGSTIMLSKTTEMRIE